MPTWNTIPGTMRLFWPRFLKKKLMWSTVHASQEVRPTGCIFFWHMLGNRVLTFLSNMLTDLNLTDMETGYKAFTRDVANRLTIKENRFGFEPEFTARVSRMGVRIYEVGISYSGRTYREGKKITWKDGISAIRCLIKYNLFK